MADARRHGIGAQLDLQQILLEAQHRWLRPAEICEILQNYKKFHIAPEPANKPSGGSLFLFDRKVLRYFRKDGHNWRKKKDGKTVKEAHERLKAGSIDVLHCYYAHGEEDENFQRRSYWMLEEELSHIVLVHYREVKGNRTNFNRIKETEEVSPAYLQTEENVTNSEVDSFISKFHPYSYRGTPQTTDTTSFSSALASEYEDAESAYNNQSSSTFVSLLELQTPVTNEMDAGLAVPYYPAPFSDDYQGRSPAISGMDLLTFTEGDRGNNSYDTGLTYHPMKPHDFLSWDNVLENSTAGIQLTPFKPSHSSAQIDSISIMPQQVHDLSVQTHTNGAGRRQELGSYPQGQGHWEVPHGDSSDISKGSVEQKLHPNLANNLNSRLQGEEITSVDLLHSLEPTFPAGQYTMPPQTDAIELKTVEAGSFVKSELQSNLTVDGKNEYSTLKQPVLDGIKGLNKLDSFDRWMSKELGDVHESHMQSTSDSYWETMGKEDGVDDSDIASHVHLDNYMLSPSLSQDQLFSIIDFSPSWAYSESKIKVLITGRFLKSQQDLENFKWACMFGEVEVPAEILADGVLRCYTPLHEAGRVPFYVTCSNRLACSEVREFEFRVNEIPDVHFADMPSGSSSEAVLHMRFVKLLSLESGSPQISVPNGHACLISKINSLLNEDDNEWEEMLKFTFQGELSAERAREQLLSKLLKERLREWLIQKITEGGKGACVLDEEGQGVLHFAAALGCDWAILPTIAAGVSVNFRDVNGWTALHWAASCGRERTVASLISLGAAPGALTDPTPKHSTGRTPADLASCSGHKGIAGYLAESSLSSHLQLLQLKEIKEGDNVDIAGIKPLQTVSVRAATAIGDGDLPLKDSLAAVCNATQAAARIHQVFRVQSFQKKQLKEYGGSGLGMSDERALSLIALKTNNAGQPDEPVHAAAIRIQNKFRSWKGRRDFLTIRQHIVKIQAYVRGHQVRKNYGKFIWSVGILKIILRWRRKGSGLRGFKSEAATEGTSMQVVLPKEDDYDFLKEGRKQTEERLQKALVRVKSMVQYPEARDQYRRLLNVVSEMQETKAKYDRILNSSDEVADFDEDLIDLEALLDDDTFMSAEP